MKVPDGVYFFCMLLNAELGATLESNSVNVSELQFIEVFLGLYGISIQGNFRNRSLREHTAFT